MRGMNYVRMMGASVQGQGSQMTVTTIEGDELKRRLERLHEAATGGRTHGHQKGAVRWFAEHRLVDLTPRAVYSYIEGRNPVPGRIVAVLELLEDQHGISHD